MLEAANSIQHIDFIMNSTPLILNRISRCFKLLVINISAISWSQWLSTVLWHVIIRPKIVIHHLRLASMIDASWCHLLHLVWKHLLHMCRAWRWLKTHYLILVWYYFCNWSLCKILR